MSDSIRRAYRFFCEHAGYATPPGRAVCSLALARAEAEAKEIGLRFVWEDDPEEYQLGDAEDNRPAYVLNCRVEDAGGTQLPVSLGGIGVNSLNDPYLRVVEAELASQAIEEHNSHLVWGIGSI